MKADEVMALVRAYARNDRREFVSCVKMIAANNSNLWGGSFSSQLLQVVTRAGLTGDLTELPKGRDGESELLEIKSPSLTFGQLVLPSSTVEALLSVVREHEYYEELRKAGCLPALKILFYGPPGTGKTSAAGALATALGVPFVVARHERIMASYLGDTSRNLGKVMDFAGQNKCVLLIDEFDSFGRARSGDDQAASAEINRMLNVLLQLMDRHQGPAVIVCATNLPGVIDKALPRRFDIRVTFEMPSESDRVQIIKRILGDDGGPFKGSHAEITRDCLQEKKRRVLQKIEAKPQSDLGRFDNS